MIKCRLCGFMGLDLTKHLKIHGMDPEKYKEKFDGSLVDPSVEIKRKQTCMKKYGDSNYKNKEAIKLSNEIFEGGHSLADPTVRTKAETTKKQKYGDVNFNNREKSKQTCLDRYGVENTAGLPSVVKKRNATLMSRYGKIFNYTPKPLESKETLIEKHHQQGLSIKDLAAQYDVTPEGVSYWFKKYGIKINKKVVVPKSKEFVSPEKTVEEYMQACLEKNDVLSFGQFGVLTENKKNLRLKRLFNAGRPYHSLRSELMEIALKPDQWVTFLAKLD